MKISVCMATYNGERYLQEQLGSILSQLGANDELIIVDDASQDATCGIVERLRDPRIQLIRNEANQGVLASFETALRQTTGEIIFLSDQDDVWHPEKVSRFMRLFETRPEITLAISDARIIDGDGRVITQSRTAANKHHSDGILRNIIINRYMGCTMAFRRNTLRFCLPFPPSIPMHDMWIGILNEIYGETELLYEPLINHRRHGGNTSPNKHVGYSKMLRWRIHLIYNLLRRRLTVSRKAKPLP
jgi:glycosyltransferase involved in cell wall biosynthesis